MATLRVRCSLREPNLDVKTPSLLGDLCDPVLKNSGLPGLLLHFQSGPPATKCHGHTPCAMFLTGTEPRCENLYSSLRSLRSPVQKFRSSRPPVARSAWAAGDQMPWPHSVCDVLNGNRTSM